MSAQTSMSHSADNTWRGFETASFPDMPRWVEILGRIGHFARGVVYFVVGLLAFKLAIGTGGELAGAQDAIREIGRQPFGQVLLIITALGLLAYAGWRWVQAAKDTEGLGTDFKGVAKRLGFAGSGVVHAFLGVFAAFQAFGSEMSSGQSDSGADWLLTNTSGQFLLGIAGIVTIGVGCFIVHKGVKSKFMSRYDFTAMSENMRKTALWAGRIGLITRGVAFAIIGGFLISSAWFGSSRDEISGLDDALAFIMTQPYGTVLLAITGVGFMCYAVHTSMMGWFRRFNVK